MISRNKQESENGIKLSGGKCIVCGWDRKNIKGKVLVVGAHVRPYESGAEFDKSDNIIALCPNHHAEYDAHNFYIDVKDNKLHFRYKEDSYEGLDVSKHVKHIKKEYLAYNQYLYEKVAKE